MLTITFDCYYTLKHLQLSNIYFVFCERNIPLLLVKLEFFI